MKLLSPSFIPFFIHVFYLFGMISKTRASYFWPLSQITSLLGLVLILLINVSNDFYEFYFSIFAAPGIDKNRTFFEFVAILYKIYALRNYPRNNDYIINNYLLLFVYSCFAMLNNSRF